MSGRFTLIWLTVVFVCLPAAGADVVSVRSGGDLNGDGYDDIVVGDPDVDEGRVLVYFGSKSGLPAAADWTASSGAKGSRFGSSVDAAGDVNKDGYADLIVGAEGEGAAFVYYGSPSGLPASPSWTARGGSAAIAGDLNGDGYDDVVVGAPDAGRAFVYYGSASGLSDAVGFTADRGSGDARFGSFVGAAGDVNGDGYADLFVGEKEGAAYVYLGSGSGASTLLGETVEGQVNDDAVKAPAWGSFELDRLDFAQSLELPEPQSGETWGVYWPVSSPVSTYMFMGAQARTFNENRNNTLCMSYNADCGAKVTGGEAAFNMVMEGSYDASSAPGRQNWIEYNWNFFPADSFFTWRPLAFMIDTDANSSRGAAKWFFQPNDLGAGDNTSLILSWPWAAVGLRARSDIYQDSGFSSWLRSADANPGGTQSGIKNRFFLDHANNRKGPYVIGIDSKIEYDSTSPDAKAGWMIGGKFTTRVSGSTDGRTFDSFDGLWVNLELVSTSTGANPRTAVGVKVKHDFSGENIVLWDKSAGFWLETPTPPGESSTFAKHYGMLIDDQRYDRVGMTSGDALRIAPQTVTHSAEGNAVLAGKGHDHGHLVIGSTHVWEETPGSIAIKGSPPTSDTDGLRVLASKRSPTSGPAAWAASGVTCDTACSNINAADCADAVTLDGPGAAVDCASTAGLRLCQCY